MGRPTKLTKPVIERVASSVREGLPYASAAALEGISERTFYDWINKGRESTSGPFHQFVVAIEEANAELHQEMALKFLNEARDGEGKAEKFLARRFAKDWSEKQTHEIQTDTPIELVVNLGRKLSIDADA